MNMVGHDNKRMQLIPATCSIEQIRQDTLSDFGSAQPMWPIYCSIEPQILLCESIPVVSALAEGRERTG
jgi:hypothetical protein